MKSKKELLVKVVGLVLVGELPLLVLALEDIEAGDGTSAGNSAQHVGTCALEEGHEAVVLHHLDGAINGGLVVSSSSRGHHHATTNGIQGVAEDSSNNSDSVSDGEVGKEVVTDRLGQRGLKEPLATGENNASNQFHTLMVSKRPK